MAKSNYLKGVRVCLLGRFKHNHTEIKKWVAAGDGVVSTAVDENTTHIVVSPDRWKKDIAPALANKQYEKIHIVSYDWLDNSIRAFTKRSERNYLWQSIAAKQQKVEDLKLKKREKKVKEAEKAAHKALTDVSYRRAFVEHISTFGGYSKSEIAQASKEPKSVPSHPYTDEDGLCYDIDLTTNKKERLSITLFETDADFSTYGFTIRTTKFNTTEIIGVNVWTALRTFKKSFRENAGVDWDDRLQIAERIKFKGGRKAPNEVIVIDDDMLHTVERIEFKGGRKTPAEVIVIDDD